MLELMISTANMLSMPTWHICGVQTCHEQALTGSPNVYLRGVHRYVCPIYMDNALVLMCWCVMLCTYPYLLVLSGVVPELACVAHTTRPRELAGLLGSNHLLDVKLCQTYSQLPRTGCLLRNSWTSREFRWQLLT